MKKLILMAIALVTLATTVNAATWICTDSKYSDEVLITIKMDYKAPSVAQVTSMGQTFVGWSEMVGLKRKVYFDSSTVGYDGFWDFALVIYPDGFTGYFDFIGKSTGQVKMTTSYYCRQK